MRTNEKRITINEWPDVNIRADYFWATDDRLVNWNDQVNLPVGWLHAKARLDLLEFTETFENLDKSMDVAVFQLYINDEFIGELSNIEEKKTEHGTILKCAVVVGYN